MIATRKAANRKEASAVAFSLLLSVCCQVSVHAQGYASGQGYSTLRTPLIPGALTSDAYQAPMQGNLPPMGSGPIPYGVTPGMTDSPTPVPSVYGADPDNISLSDSSIYPITPGTLAEPGVLGPSLAGSIPGPPSTPGMAQGMLVSQNGYPIPSVQTTISSSGGMGSDQAPQTRRGGQTTQDFGLTRTFGSQLTDFGQPLSQLNLAKQPQYSQDGPRQASYPGQVGSSSLRASNLTGAQTIADPGYRVLVPNNGANQAPTMIIAPY